MNTILTMTTLPKPIAGQTFKGHIKINRAQLRKWMGAGNPFNGFIVGNKVHSFHFFGGWFLACKLEKGSWEEMEKSLNEFEHYLDRELGNRAAIYLKIREW